MTKKTTPFSIKSLAIQSVDMPIRHPITGKPIINPETKKEVTLQIVSPSGREFHDATETAKRKMQTIYEQSKQLPTVEQRNDITYSTFVTLVSGWNEETEQFFADELGENSKYSVENALKLLSKPEYFWLVTQIETFISDTTRFFPKQ